MTTPDKGIELGWEQTHWSAQVDFTNGSANTGGGTGPQINRAGGLHPPRLARGVLASFEQAELGNRRLGGLFTGLTTGPVAWLGELDMIHDDSFPGGRTLAAGLLEGDWRIRRGHYPKLTV